MKTTLLISLCAVVASAFPLAASQPEAAVDKFNGFDEHLSFNDNLIPPGWAITFPYGGPGRNAEVANQRFQVEKIDTYGCLEKAKTLPAGDNTIALRFAVACGVPSPAWATRSTFYCRTGAISWSASAKLDSTPI